MGAGTPAAGIPATFSLRQGILCVSVSLAKRVVKVLTRLFMLFSDSALVQRLVNIWSNKDSPPVPASGESGLEAQRHRGEKEENVARSFQMASTPFEKIAQHLSGRNT
jgi:hypothetical protein